MNQNETLPGIEPAPPAPEVRMVEVKPHMRKVVPRGPRKGRRKKPWLVRLAERLTGWK